MSRVYLDHNATTPLRGEARVAMIAAMDVVGNPSSVHAEGRAAKALVETARAQVASLVGCDPHDIVFTSGATEAASLAAAAKHTGPNHGTAVSANCHDAFIALGHPICPMLPSGQSDASYADAHPPAYLAHSVANSETGILDTGLIRRAALDAGFGLIADVTQSVHRDAFDFSDPWNAMAVLSAHKLGGPKGVGCVVIKPGIDVTPSLRGGGQEMGRRSGTENVIGIAGFGAAAAAAQRDLEAGAWAKIEKLRNILESALEAASNATIFIGKESRRLPNTSCFATPGWKGETQVMQMDLAGFAISAGSACSSGKVKASRVLTAMGFEDVAAHAVRVSLGLETTEQDVLRFADIWAQKLKKHEARAA